MPELSARLLDVLKETLECEERICCLMEQHKKLLIAGREVTAESILDEIQQLCSSVSASESRREAVVREIAEVEGLDPTALTANKLLELPSLLSIREELAFVTTRLRQVVKGIVQLRDEIEALALHAKAYSDFVLSMLQQNAQTKPYGSATLPYSRFISVRT
ncbi:hypothetical protein AAC03nite_24360 [Alicyclobacillus acidoterrestris]|uniref:flagellar export chaperone FlgN n=1 Tax=Alicyclobacillus suci TaxID=2816080 RepID=UPI00118FF3B3|nr:flagellar export chaperone FlgN [Alicyclobacillus suci]GEO26651.1 hypothetical protein AAC03nite_24360 [Alicyclobacillus acidoterrestris]